MGVGDYPMAVSFHWLSSNCNLEATFSDFIGQSCFWDPTLCCG
uniref:F-box and leucine-rich repeat protein 21 n=1 Tax=Mus musculus TaxID=10090 RepID=D6RE27_MOUSE